MAATTNAEEADLRLYHVVNLNKDVPDVGVSAHRGKVNIRLTHSRRTAVIITTRFPAVRYTIAICISRITAGSKRQFGHKSVVSASIMTPVEGSRSSGEIVFPSPASYDYTTVLVYSNSLAGSGPSEERTVE
jgi:hypothetical protein